MPTNNLVFKDYYDFNYLFNLDYKNLDVMGAAKDYDNHIYKHKS
jgi:hypothetical protein